MTLHPTEIIFLFFRFTRIASSIRIPDYKKSVAILAATKDKAIENTAGRVKENQNFFFEGSFQIKRNISNTKKNERSNNICEDSRISGVSIRLLLLSLFPDFHKPINTP